MNSVWVRGFATLKSLWLFSRPHTIFATTLQVLVGAAFAVGNVSEFAHKWPFFLFHAVLMIVFGLALNIYVVGINQLTDVEIDKINKPGLPLAVGSLSVESAKKIVFGCAIAALLCGLYLGKIWALGVSLILFLGTLYSCEPFRLKKYAVWSGLTIAICRGVIFNLTTYYTWCSLYPNSAFSIFDNGILTLCLFMFCYVLAIGIFKDLPDFTGDKEHNILTYAVKYGLKRSFWAGVVLLACSYVSIIFANIFQFGMVRSHLFIALMSVSLIALILAAFSLNNVTKTASAKFYRIVWALFYLGLGSFSAYALL